MKLLKKYKWSFITTAVILGIYLVNNQRGLLAVQLTFSNFKTVLSLLPPIFIIIGLMDVWVPRETMIKYMGEKSGLKGGLLALLIGSIGAGPLYVAFPVGALLVKKGARLAYVFLFLCTWSSMKLPILMYEWAALGGRFTIIHIASSIVVYVIGSFMMERFLSQQTKDKLIESVQSVA